MGLKDLQRWLNNKAQGYSNINNNTIDQQQQKKKELKKDQQQLLLHQSERFEIFRDKPFWINDISQHKAEDIRTKGNVSSGVFPFAM